MAISYNIYGNGGDGGDVDYSTPIATTTGLAYQVGPLAAPSDNRFAVRAIDTISGIEEANSDAAIRIIIDPAGNDVSARPNAVVGLSAWPTVGGSCWVSWGYIATGQGGPPSSFNVTLIPGPSASTANPVATVDYLPGVVGYSCTLSGLPANVPCTIAIQAVGASSLLVGPTTAVSLTYLATPLSDVDSLVGTPMA